MRSRSFDASPTRRSSPASPIRERFAPAGDFSAWVGLVLKQNSSGGREKLGSITKQGDRYLRSLLCAGTLTVTRPHMAYRTVFGLLFTTLTQGAQHVSCSRCLVILDCVYIYTLDRSRGDPRL